MLLIKLKTSAKSRCPRLPLTAAEIDLPIELFGANAALLVLYYRAPQRVANYSDFSVLAWRFNEADKSGEAERNAARNTTPLATGGADAFRSFGLGWVARRDSADLLLHLNHTTNSAAAKLGRPFIVPVEARGLPGAPS